MCHYERHTVAGRIPRERPAFAFPEAAVLDRAFLRWLCVIAALLLALLWLVSVTVTGFAAPAWIPPAGLLAIVLAVALP